MIQVTKVQIYMYEYVKLTFISSSAGTIQTDSVLIQNIIQVTKVFMYEYVKLTFIPSSAGTIQK